MSRHVALGITGASGSLYPLRLAEVLLGLGARVTLLISAAGFTVLKEECDLHWSGSEDEVRAFLQGHFGGPGERLTYFGADNWLAPVASGSSAPDAMVICPCSMGTLARVAHGTSTTVLERGADVMLKEGRPLVLVPRETPLSAVHLENMLSLARLGVKILPAMPGFYHKPGSVQELVDFLVGKILDALRFEHRLFRRWGEP